MKNSIKTIVMALFAIAFLSLAGCHRDENITVSHDTLWFSTEASSQTIEITTDCSWSIEKNDNAQWYTVSPMSGEKSKNGTTITISVQEYQGEDYRAASFTIKSPKGKGNVTVNLSQNVVEFTSIINTVYGVKKVEQWNTDFYGNVIADSYKEASFNPHDTTTGFTMYFAGDGYGIQVDRYHDSTVYYPFHYNYDNVTRNLHIEFELIDTTQTEIYNASVLTATEGMFRFQHEYKPDFWERAEMTKIGTIDPQTKIIIGRAIAKRKESGPIFNLK
ncbi:MAG: BACON domain-containing protein [Bacteroidales bacterium]|nr:BACON domain-containing protein [Bacteroidales bacterium]